MNKKILVAAVLIAAAIAAFWWTRTQRKDAQVVDSPSARQTEDGANKGIAATNPRVPPDPRQLALGSISGVIKDEQGAAIAGAHICGDIDTKQISAQLITEPICTDGDAQGKYELKQLFAAHYSIDAAAPTYIPATYKPYPKGHERAHTTSFQLNPGENRTRVDIVLRNGGVQVTGTVSDISGGPVAKARVRIAGYKQSSPPVIADDNGKYTLWTEPGSTGVAAAADGYAGDSEEGQAPGIIDIKLTPGSAIAGTVIDREGKPVPGALVEIDTIEGSRDWDGNEKTDITDDNGRFKIAKLSPGRYLAEASTANGFGKASESTLLGLGQVVDGVVVRLFPASYVDGTIVKLDGDNKTICNPASVALSDTKNNKNQFKGTDDDGVIRFKGLLPGNYKVIARCQGYNAKDLPPVIVVAGKDQTLTWEVSPGATLRGVVKSKSGLPIKDVNVRLQATKSADDGMQALFRGGFGQTDSDGEYEISGAEAGPYEVIANSSSHTAPTEHPNVELMTGQTKTLDMILNEGGKLRATIVDSDGKPVKGATLNAKNTSQGSNVRFFFSGRKDMTSGADGIVVKAGLNAGEYRAYATRGWMSRLRKPGSTDDDVQGEKVTVKDGETVNVKLVVESQRGVISGSVVSATKEPVTDAYVIASRESDAAGASSTGAMQSARWSFDDSVLTDTSGSFKVVDLAPGKYTVRAYRKGGGESFVEHVAVGSTITIGLKTPGMVSGIVIASGAPVQDFAIELQDNITHFSREESFYRTDGKFVLRDIPAGNYEIVATANAATGKATFSLAQGATKSDVQLALGNTVTVTGTVVDELSQKPAVGLRMSVSADMGGANSWSDDSKERVTDDKGRFSIPNVAAGRVLVSSWSMRDKQLWGSIFTHRNIPDTAGRTFDIGIVSALKSRTPNGEAQGDPGISFKQSERWSESIPLEVVRIDPTGPCGKLDVKVGDVLVAVDGIDIGGERGYLANILMEAPAGTKIELAFARGNKISVTLSPPR
jgi:protocatechuate 3,4-dioxygenase beta subunit